VAEATGYGSSQSTSPGTGVGLKITFVKLDAAAAHLHDKPVVCTTG